MDEYEKEFLRAQRQRNDIMNATLKKMAGIDEPTEFQQQLNAHEERIAALELEISRLRASR